MNIQELAEASGVSNNTIYRYIRRFPNPQREVLVKLANALGCHIDDLFPNWSPQKYQRRFTSDIKWMSETQLRSLGMVVKKDIFRD